MSVNECECVGFKKLKHTGYHWPMASSSSMSISENEWTLKWRYAISECCQCMKLGATTAQDSEEAMTIDWYNSAVMTWIVWRVSESY